MFTARSRAFSADAAAYVRALGAKTHRHVDPQQAVQDLLADPPFSRLDFVPCRNLLIYLGQEAQAKVMDLFHFALREGGILLLGGAETTLGLSDAWTREVRGSTTVNRPLAPEAPSASRVERLRKDPHLAGSGVTGTKE